MTKLEEFVKLQEELAKRADITQAERIEFRLLGLSAMAATASLKERDNIERLISHTLGDSYVR